LGRNYEDISKKALSRISTRILIVWGNRDRYFPPYIPLELYQDLSDASLWSIPKQGHTPFWVEFGGDDTFVGRFIETARRFFRE